jgi:hypothetical protein
VLNYPKPGFPGPYDGRKQRLGTIPTCFQCVSRNRGPPYRSTVNPDHQQAAPSQPTFLNVREAAVLLRLSEITLSRWRLEGGGPPYRKFGRRVLYARSDLLAWADAQVRHSTSEQP